jgi:hypothetical protein
MHITMKLKLSVAKVLAECWKHDLLIYQFIIHVVGTGDVLAKTDWPKALEHCGLNPETHVKQPVRSWVASHFVNASNEFWLNHPNKAMQWIISGDDYGASTRPMKRARGAFREEAGYKVIRARALDKRHDWNTCK